MTEYPYDISVDNEEVSRLLSEKQRPWWDARVLDCLHNELHLSLAEIGQLFNISRQSVRHAAKELDVSIERKKSGYSKIIDKEQKRLSEYEPTGMAKFM
ncbi:MULTISPECIES: hypothetical protein [unclassified Haloarcula]|uniref:hypothetical protein n=1 Tax=unclassified Haloarcula TaxID=2624677 RepID=UPI0012458550|nr:MULTISPECIES: hypothetical protein [unclassified Haloarcula]